MKTVGVIGGSGLYQMDGLQNLKDVVVETPFGMPSDSILQGELGGVRLLFLPRHGKNHHLTPSEVPYRANIWALKSLGASWIISASAVGSLREEIAPGHMVLVDQFIDRTKGRISTFFGEGVVAHIAFGDPVCAVLRQFMYEAATECGATTHDGGTYVCMEGPAFSTRAESQMYRSWGGTVIGMTNLPEAKLAREAEMSYATLGMATDYDCWHAGHEDVTVEQVLSVLRSNADMARRIIAAAVLKIAAYEGLPPYHDALSTALMTPAHAIPPQRKADLTPLISKYVGE